MHTHWLFTWNVLAHLVASMSGFVSFCIAIYEAFRNKKFESWAFFFVGAVCLIVGFDQAWQDEHRNSEVLKTEKSAATSERDFWKEQSYNKDRTIQQRDQAIQQRDNLLAQNYTALVGEQALSAKTQGALTSLSNKILDISKPASQKFTVRREDAIKFDGYKHQTVFLLMTNLPAAAHIWIRCEQDIPTLEAHIIEGGPRFPGSVEQANSKTWLIHIPSPQITPQNPLIVNVGYNTDSLGICEEWQQ